MDREQAKQIARYEPEKYVSEYLYTNPEFADITENMIDNAIQSTSGNFFYYNFDAVPEFKKYSKRAAIFVASRNPLMALLVYRLNKRPEFRNDVELAKILLISLVREMKGDFSDLSDASSVLNKSQISNDAFSLVETIAKNDPKFYQESGLAEDPEFGKFFNYVGRGE